MIKTKGANTTLYFGDTAELKNGVGIVHLFANGQRIASIRTDGETQYYHGNHLGSASVVTDQNGDLKQKIEYFPYGTYRYGASPNQQYGTYDYDSAFPNSNYTFTDQEDDDETGLYNYKARLYDPLIGRFISADSIVPEPGDLQAFNRYSYTKNNPLFYKDPSGHALTPFHMFSEFIGSSIGLLFGCEQNPFMAAKAQWSLDIEGMRNLSVLDVAAIHATATTGASRGEALNAAWASLTNRLNDTGQTNHTFYDILTHWGGRFNEDFRLGDLSTWTAGDVFHFVVNDTILGAIFLPVAVVESTFSNTYSALKSWFGTESSYSSVTGNVVEGSAVNSYGDHNLVGAGGSGGTYYDIGGNYDYGSGSGGEGGSTSNGDWGDWGDWDYDFEW